MTCLLRLRKPGASNGLTTFQEISIVELFFRRVALQHDSSQRHRGPKVLDFRAVCVAWVLDVLDHYEAGCNQLQALFLAGLDDLDDTRAFPEQLRSYVARTGGLLPAVSAARSADEKCFHSLGLHGRGSYLGKIPKGCGLGNE